MDYQSIVSQLDAYIREHFEIGDDPDYATDVHLFDYGFVDSLGAVEIISYVESAFGCEITQRDITLYPMNTVEEIASVVAGKLK